MPRSLAGAVACVLSVVWLAALGTPSRAASSSETPNRNPERPVWSPYRPTSSPAALVGRSDNSHGESAPPQVDQQGTASDHAQPTTSVNDRLRDGRVSERLQPTEPRPGSASFHEPLCEPGSPIEYIDPIGCCDAPVGCCDPVAGPYYSSGAHLYDPSVAWHTYPYFPLLSDRLWVRTEYLLWWTQGFDTPPLVTTSPPGTPQPDAGVLGQSDTSILFGNTGLNTDARSGGRLTVGYWLTPDRRIGVEANYLGIGKTTDRFQANSTGDPILGRPFLNIQTGQQDAHLVAFPGLTDQGSIAARATTAFQSSEVLFRGALADRGCVRLDALLGYRFSRLDDDLFIGESILAPGPTTIDLYDLFDTKNTFHGGQLGIVAHVHYFRWSLELLMKVGLGNTRSTVIIDGFTRTAVNGTTDEDAGGLLAQQTNIGRYVQDNFAVIPELGITLGFDITDHLRATFGYTFIYWSCVARPGDQIDFDLNRSYFPNAGPPTGPARPQFAFVPTDFWSQGMNFGLEYSF